MTAVFKHLATVSLAVAACARPAPAPVHARAAVRPLSHRATSQRTPADRDNDFTLAWTAWASGNRADATAMFQKLVREIRSVATVAKPFALVSGAAGAMSLAVSSDGTRGVAQSRAGVFWFDGRGAPLRYDPVAASSIAFVPGTTLAVLTDPNLTIIDATSFDRVFAAPNVIEAKASPSGKRLVYVEYTAAKTTLHLWDVATKRDQRTFELRAGESWQLFSIDFSPDEKDIFFQLRSPDVSDELGNTMDAGDELLVMIDDAGNRLDFPARLGNSRPSFSGDGKYVAYAHTTFSDDNPRSGKTILIDRATRTQIVSTAVNFPTATQFSNNGKYLLVGDLRKLHVLDVPSLRVIATTPELRPRLRYGGDDMQDIGNIDVVDNDKAFSASTADGTTGVFRIPSAKLVWKGPEGTPAERVPSPHGIQLAVDGALVTIDDNFTVTHRRLTPAELASHVPDPTEALSAHLESTVCTVGDRIFPIAACH